MGAPAKSGAGERKQGKPNGEIQPSEGRISPTGAAAPGRRTRGSARSARADAIRSRTPAKPKAKAKRRPRRYDTTASSRPRILEVASQRAAELGYENLKLSDITEGAEISHQGFYIHFKNKRHAVAVATSDQLGAVASMVISSSKEDELWAKRLEEEIDNALAEAYPAPDGPESKLRRKFVELVESGSFNRTRIEELVKVSTLGHGEFYRRYGGKKGSLRRIYGQALAELEEEIGPDRSLPSLAGALASDHDRAKLLVLGASYLPAGPELERGVSTGESLPRLIEAAVATAGRTGPLEIEMISGAVQEVIRSTALADTLESLVDRIAATSSVVRPMAPAAEPVGHLLAA